MIVWGVDCRKNVDDVDEVIGFVPVQGLRKFASDMRDWTIEATMPRLSDVRVELIDEGGDSGFLLVDVPRSEQRPHQSELGEKAYYRSTGASSRRMEHFEIEDAFRRISIPELRVEYRLGGGSSQLASIVGGVTQAACSITLFISLRNVSRVSARSAYVATFQTAFYPARHLTTASNITFREQPPQRFFEIEPATIHPDVSRLVAPLELKFDLVKQVDVWIARPEPFKQAQKPLVIGFGCLDTRMRTETITLSPEEILAAIDLKPVLLP